MRGGGNGSPMGVQADPLAVPWGIPQQPHLPAPRLGQVTPTPPSPPFPSPPRIWGSPTHHGCPLPPRSRRRSRPRSGRAPAERRRRRLRGGPRRATEGDEQRPHLGRETNGAGGGAGFLARLL